MAHRRSEPLYLFLDGKRKRVNDRTEATKQAEEFLLLRAHAGQKIVWRKYQEDSAYNNHAILVDERGGVGSHQAIITKERTL